MPAWFPVTPQHTNVIAWLRQNRSPLITSDFVIDETLTLLRSRGEASRAIALGRRVLDLGGVKVHFLSEPEVRAAWAEFRNQPERGWSFTDCTSEVIMDRLHIHKSLTFDRHFAEFGAVELAP